MEPFPLVASSYDNAEILACIEVLLSGRLTMGERVREFERAMAQRLGVFDCVMVNSGSSANLLAVAAATNPTRLRKLRLGDGVAIPAVCWSTSLWPIVQAGLVPVMVDVDPHTLNLSVPSLLRAVEERGVRAVQLVHVMGNATDIRTVFNLAINHDGLIILEDTCEALGSMYCDLHLGALGDFGTFSFYFSHHITTIEGGLVTAHSAEDADLLRCLRAHGWSREQRNRAELEAANPNIDSRFLFVNAGYNVRPMELQAAFGLQQLPRLNSMNTHRRLNVYRIRDAFRAHPRWSRQLIFPAPPPDVDPCWFGFPFLVRDRIDRKAFTAALLDRGIDTRPIVSGNMALQPAVRMFNVDLSLGPFTGAQLIHDQGFAFGCYAAPLSDETIAELVNAVLEALPLGPRMREPWTEDGSLRPSTG